MKRSLLHILFANVVFLIISIVNSFLLPRYLSIDTYAVLKTYTLYIGYAGFLSLGYADGMYLKYGGAKLEDIQISELSSNLKSYIALQGVVSLFLLLVAVILKDYVLIAFAISSLCINIIGYYKNFYQAIGEYRLYGQSLNYQTFILFLLNLALLFVWKIKAPMLYIGIQVISAIATAIYLTWVLEKKTSLWHLGQIRFSEIKTNIVSGFSLMLGNFSSSVFTSLDRWFVKILLDSSSFAHYSFAVSLENIINVFITPITISLYNVFCKNPEKAYIYRIKKLTLLWGFMVVALFFPVKFILSYYLTKYYVSVNVLYPLFGAQAFYAVIKGISVNLYKADRKQTVYFKVMACMIVLSIALNIIVYKLLHTSDAFAIATLLTSIIWFMYCEWERPEIRFTFKEYSAIILLLLSYILACRLDNIAIGLLCYLVAYSTIFLVFMRESLKDIIIAATPFVEKLLKNKAEE